MQFDKERRENHAFFEISTCERFSFYAFWGFKALFNFFNPLQSLITPKSVQALMKHSSCVLRVLNNLKGCEDQFWNQRAYLLWALMPNLSYNKTWAFHGLPNKLQYSLTHESSSIFNDASFDTTKSNKLSF